MARIETPFRFSSTTTDVTQGIDLIGRRVVVTSANSGLGWETARALAAIGADALPTARSSDAGNRAATEIIRATGNDRLRATPLELSDPASIAWLVQDWRGPLRVLVNNAGGIPPTLQRTAEGVGEAVRHQLSRAPRARDRRAGPPRRCPM